MNSSGVRSLKGLSTLASSTGCAFLYAYTVLSKVEAAVRRVKKRCRLKNCEGKALKEPKKKKSSEEESPLSSNDFLHPREATIECELPGEREY